MPELDAKDRDDLRKNQFAYVDKDGGEHLPINDASHVRNAMARFNQTDFESQTAKEEARKKILAAAKRYDIEVDDANIAVWVATHGRGVWSTTTMPLLEFDEVFCCGYIDPWDPPPMARVFGQAFDPFESSRLTARTSTGRTTCRRPADPSRSCRTESGSWSLRCKLSFSERAFAQHRSRPS